ncbi:MAG: response regulator transcription factor [Thermomicrobiales bacterium]
MTPPLPVLVIAGSPALRAGIAALLATDAGITPLLDAPETGSPLAAIVLDLESGDRAAADVEAIWPKVPLVLLGGRDVLDGQVFIGAPLAMLAPDADADALGAAVRAVAAGLIVIDPERGASLFRPRTSVGTPDPGEALTPREREVLALVADGLPNKAIARELGISEHTAKFHVGSLLGKLDAASRAEAVAIATRRGVLPV